MKIRTGFVSNSSSSSFTIFGLKFNVDELAELFNVVPKIPEEFNNIVHINKNEVVKAVLEILNKKITKKLAICIDSSEDGINEIYIGWEPNSLPQDKTLKEMESWIRTEVLKDLGSTAKNGFDNKKIRFFCGEEDYHVWEGIDR